MLLGIEIGGTKLQLGVGHADGSPPAALERHDVAVEFGAAGILEHIEETARRLIARHDVARIGIGFGGPIDARRGRVVKSHQVPGWDDFPLVEWCRDKLGLSAVLGNDCDAAALAEARFGAGKGARSVFFVTAGTGVGGGLVIDGQLYGAGRPAAAEIGHLRPLGLSGEPEATVESLASGRGIEASCRTRLAERRGEASRADCEDLLNRAGGDSQRLTAKTIGEAATAGNSLAREVLDQATAALGWAIAQMVTLLAPEVVVVGGGVSLIGEELFLRPLREAAARAVFPPLAGSYEIVPARLGELVVVHGALALAAEQ